LTSIEDDNPAHQQRCAGCGSLVSASHRFCPACGLPLTRGERPAGRTADADVTTLAHPEDRRLVSALVAALPGVAELGERVDPEVLRYVEASFVEVVGGVVRRYDGTLAKAGRSEVVAWFGAPLAHEDDAERAVLAGLDLLDESAELSADIKHRHHVHPQSQVGIATGEVVSGPLAEMPANFTILGPTVDLARALASTGTPGEQPKYLRATGEPGCAGGRAQQPGQRVPAHGALGGCADGIRRRAGAARMGNRRDAAGVHNNIAEVHRGRGELGEAIARFERAMAIWDEIGDPIAIALALTGSGAARVEAGDIERGRADLLDAEAQFAALGNTKFLPDLYRFLALAELAAGDLGAAERAAEQSVDYARAANVRYQEAATQRVLAEIAIARGKVNEARELLESSRQTLVEVGHAEELARTEAVLLQLR
jgi:class 3 adenylate cyclase